MNARNSLKSLAVSSDSDLSEVFPEPFITQTKAALITVLQLSFRKTILSLYLRVQTTRKQLTISIFAPRIFRPSVFTDKEDSGRGFTTVTDKEIQSRNEQARVLQNTKRLATCLHGVHEFGI